MKSFNVPVQYRSPLISSIKKQRKEAEAAAAAKARRDAVLARRAQEREEEGTTSMNENKDFFEQLSQANKNPLASLHEARLKKISLAIKKKAVEEGSVSANIGGYSGRADAYPAKHFDPILVTP